MATYMGQSLAPEVLSRPQRRLRARDLEARTALAKESAAESKPEAKAPHPIGAHRLFAVLQCDFCGQPAGNSDGAGPVCYLCWQSLYLPIDE